MNYSGLFRNIFLLTVAVMLTSFSFKASAQSRDEIAMQIVSEIAKTLNSPDMRQTMIDSDDDITGFSAFANGKTLAFTIEFGKVNFNALSDTKKQDLVERFSHSFVEGLLESAHSGPVVKIFKDCGVRVMVKLKDGRGYVISKLYEF